MFFIWNQVTVKFLNVKKIINHNFLKGHKDIFQEPG